MADDLSRLRIAKKAYVFDSRKKFTATKNFLLKKKPESRAEDIKQNIASLFAKKKPELETGRPGDAAKPSAPAPPKKEQFLTPLTMALLVTVVIVLGGGIFLILSLGATHAAPAQPPPAHVFGGAYDFSIQDSRLLTIGSIENPQRSGFLLVGYDSANLTGLNFSASFYSDHPPTQVFILDYARDSADTYPTFRKELMSGLEANGFPASEIEIEKASLLPPGSLLIVPTGYFPDELLGVGSSYNFKGMLARGVTIVYIGLPFNDKALQRDGLTVESNFSELAFAKPEAADALKSTEGFALSNARYSAMPVQGGASGFSSVGMLYGSASAVKLGNGYMIFLPQSLDGGWHADGPKQAAADVLRLVSEQRWLVSTAGASTAADLSGGNHVLSLFTNPFQSDFAYVEFVASAADSQGITRQSRQVYLLQKTQKGEMTPTEPQTVPFYLSGASTSLNIKLQEPGSTPVKLYINMYKDGVLNQTSEVERGSTDPTTERFPVLEVDAEPGNYTVLVQDGNGNVYAATQLSVIGLDIYQNLTDYANGRFSFLLSANGASVSPPDFTVSLDGQSTKEYFRDSLSYTSDGTATVVDYSNGQGVKTGKHAFLFSFANRWSKELPVEYVHTPPFWENPIVIFLAVVSLAVFGVGILLRRPEVLKYGLDIPDFPPLSTIKIPVKRSTVLEMFDSVNAAYSWQWMPLRTEELKNGFRKLTYNGKPILIGDFNLERILAHLKGEGLVKEEIGYWGKAEWEKDSRHTIAYLTIYRILRNVFVNNAVKFSKLDAMPECDVKAIAGKEEIYLHIMEPPYEPKVHRALATSKKGTTMMVFLTEEERDNFRDSLTSTSKLAVGLKMEVNSGNILLLPVKNSVSAYLKGIMK